MIKSLKKYFILILTLLIGVGLFTGCGTSTSDNKNVLKVGATPKPHAEILEYIKPILAEDGIELDIVVFNDYVQPNKALDEGELDANYFQHIPYLESFSQEHNLDLTYIAKVHIEPMGLYPNTNKISSLDELKKGDVIAIPNDTTNAGRALALLEKAGLIKLADGAGLEATVQDIVSNPKDLEIKMLDAAQLPRALQDVAAAVINTNYALEAGLNPLNDALVIEEGDSPYANVLAVRTKDKDNEKLKKLAEVLNSEEVKKYIEDTYKGAILPAF